MLSVSKLSREVKSALAPSGFELSYFDDTEIVMFSLQESSLFHRIRVSLFTSGEQLAAGVELSVVPGRTALKSLCIHECLMEAAENSDGTTAIRDSDQLDRFLDRLISWGPTKCNDLERREGLRLKASTQAARLACSKYLERLQGPVGPNAHSSRTDCSVVTEPLNEKEVNRILAEWIQCIPDATGVYRDVVQIIVRECDDVEGVRGWIENRRANSASDRELMMRIQILASILAREPGADRIALTS